METKKLLKTLDYYDEKLWYIKGSIALLDYDKTTRMPKKSFKERAKQISILSEEYHKLFLNKELKKTIKELNKKEHYEKLNYKDKKRIKIYYKEIKKAEKLPLKFIRELSELQSIAQTKWEEAKTKNDYKIFKPYLKKLVEKYKEKTKLLDKKAHPYNVLLDDYEEGMDYKKIKKVFEELKVGLKKILEEIKNTKKYKEQKKLKKKILSYNYPYEIQKKLNIEISKKILDNKERWILEESMHPFTTTINENDIRITTAYKKNPMFSYSATIHESGHALFELQMNNLKGILHDSPSLGLHESQSRFWENHVGLNEKFWDAKYKKFKKEYSLKNITKKEWYDFINIIEPGFIRIEADELTYPFHVIIRFELELELFEGKITVEELQKKWNEKYEEYLGVKIKKDSEGILQDVHWSLGSFGYFPTYMIGTLYAATIYEYLKTKYNIDEKIKREEYSFIREWLKKHIHKHGRLYTAEEIIKKATKKTLNSKDYLKYIKEKYKKIYNI